MNVLRSTTPEQVRDAVRRAMAHREWLILMFHYLVDEPTLDTEYGIEDFRRVVALVAAERPDVRPLSEVWDGWQALAAAQGGRAAERNSFGAPASVH